MKIPIIIAMVLAAIGGLFHSCSQKQAHVQAVQAQDRAAVATDTTQAIQTVQAAQSRAQEVIIHVAADTQQAVIAAESAPDAQTPLPDDDAARLLADDKRLCGDAPQICSHSAKGPDL